MKESEKQVIYTWKQIGKYRTFTLSNSKRELYTLTLQHNNLPHLILNGKTRKETEETERFR